MKYFSWIITLPITVLVVTFAVVNRGTVAVDLWPLQFEVSLPLFVLVLGSALVGFFAGAAVMWWSGGKLRQKFRTARGDVDRLERRNRSLEQARQPATPSNSAPGLPAVTAAGGTAVAPASSGSAGPDRPSVQAR